MTSPAPLDEPATTASVAGHGGSSMADAAPIEDAAAGLPFPTIAIGASAGGVEALLRFFRNTPDSTGCAYVVLMHLDPERESMLAELLGRATRMRVAQAEDGSSVEADHVYIVPPGQYVEMRD